MEKSGTTKEIFLKRLQGEAELQARLHKNKILPAQLDKWTSLVGRYPWQCLLGLSALSSVVVELAKLL